MRNDAEPTVVGEQENYEDHGVVDGMQDAGLDALDNLPGEKPTELACGVLDGTDFPASSVDNTPTSAEFRERTPYTIGLKAATKCKENSIGITPSKAFSLGSFVGAVAPVGAFFAANEPAFLLPYATNAIDAANYVDRNYLTGNYDSAENLYEEAKERVRAGMDSIWNAKDDVIAYSKNRSRNSGSDGRVELHETGYEEFFDIARELDDEGDVIAFAGDPYATKSVGETKRHIDALKEKDNLEVASEDLKVEVLEDEYNDSAEPGKIYILRIESKTDTAGPGPEENIFELSARWPAENPDLSFSASEENTGL